MEINFDQKRPEQERLLGYEGRNYRGIKLTGYGVLEQTLSWNQDDFETKPVSVDLNNDRLEGRHRVSQF